MRRVKNLGASVRQRLLDEAKRRGESFDYVASLYARERFLTRLAQSPHRNRLILKGATVFALWGDVHRPSRDLDFLGSGNFNVESAIAVIRDIVSIQAEDGMKFDVQSVTGVAIRETNEYRGARIHLDASLDTMRIRMQIDIGLGDVVTPAARQATLPVILEDLPRPRVKVYPAETIVAEKLHAMVKLGIANSRMKDFFDIWVLASTHEFDEDLLARAVRRTFDRRRTTIPEEAFALSEAFYADGQKQTLWRAFLRKNGLVAPTEFSVIGNVLRSFLVPLLTSARDSVKRYRQWRRGRWTRTPK
jgi:predicted nucleotidyltransferase component of viral defense system